LRNAARAGPLANRGVASILSHLTQTVNQEFPTHVEISGCQKSHHEG
jgi:hypothetical protein